MRAVPKTGLAVALAALAVGGILVASALRRGFSARDEPTRLEAVVARAARHWALPGELRNAKNPVALTPAVLAEAREHFADHCATCHDNDGKGRTSIGQRLYPRAPDMTLQETQRLSDGELFAIIENGVRLTGMPGWGDGTSQSRRASWALVHFIRHLPNITPAELAEMKRNNPISPKEMAEEKAEESFLEGNDNQH